MVEYWLISLIDTRWTLYRHLSWHLMGTWWWTSQSTICGSIHMSQLTPGRPWINWVSADSRLRCQSIVSQDVNWVSIKDRWRVSINTLLQMPSEHMNHQMVHAVKAYLSFHNMKHLDAICFLRWIITNEWHGNKVRRNDVLIKWVHFLQVVGYMVLYQGAINTHYQKRSEEWVCEQLCQSDMLRWGSLSAVI